jgi:hypothetical protein
LENWTDFFTKKRAQTLALPEAVDTIFVFIYPNLVFYYGPACILYWSRKDKKSIILLITLEDLL